MAYLRGQNTGFFHAITKRCKVMNKFSVIENDEGQTFYEDQILGVISEYYQTLFTTKPGVR